MKITEVRPKKSGLSFLFIDGEYAMALDTQTLAENRFSQGREITDEELQRVIGLSNERRAKEKALCLISYRDHSKKELAEKLRRKYDGESAEKAVDRLEELGLINDERFAQRYAEQLIQVKNMSAGSAVYALCQKGVDRELAQRIVEEISPDAKEHIRNVINKKYKNISDEKTRKRAVAALQRLGYRWDDIKSVLNEYDEDDYI